MEFDSKALALVGAAGGRIVSLVLSVTQTIPIIHAFIFAIKFFIRIFLKIYLIRVR